MFFDKNVISKNKRILSKKKSRRDLKINNQIKHLILYLFY